MSPRSIASALTLIVLPVAGAMAASDAVPGVATGKQDTPYHQQSLDPMEITIVTANRRDQPLETVSASLSAIDREALMTVRHTHISELLNRVPGTWISRGNGQEHLTAIRSPVFTGAGSCGSFYMAEDGIPLRPAGFCNVNQLFEANSEQAQRIEVLRGPGTALHGGNALHGVINVISRAPAEQRQTDLSLEAGPHDYLRGRLSHSEPLGDLGSGSHALRMSINGVHDGGYKDDSGFDQQKLSLRHDWQGADRSVTTALTAANLNQETAGYIQGKGAYKISHLKRDNPDPEAFRDNTAFRLYSRWQFDTEDGEWVVTPFLRHQRMEFLQHFLPGLPLEENGLDSIGLQLARYWQGEWVNGSVGMDVEYTDAYLKETQEQPAGPPFPLGAHYDYEVEALRWAVFGQADWQLTERDQLTTGVRFEQQRYDYDNRMLSGSTDAAGDPCIIGGQPDACRYSRPADRSDRFNDYSLNVGWIHRLDRHQQLVLQLARGFRAPEAAELYRLQAGQLGTDLDSERLDSIELGWRWHSDALRLAVTAFDMRKRDVIFQDAQRRNISDGRTRHSGLEAELVWAFATDWQLSAQGSWARHRYTDNVHAAASASPGDIDGNDIATAPRHMGSVQLAWQPVDATRIELEWQHTGRYYLDMENRHSYSGHDLLNLRVTQQLNPQLSVGLRLVNLTDADYAERADYAFGEYRYFVGEPRSLYVDLSLSF